MDPGIVTRREEPGDLGRRLTGRDFRRVERVALDENHLAPGDGLVDLLPRMASRILKDRVHPLVVVKAGQVLRRRR